MSGVELRDKKVRPVIFYIVIFVMPSIKEMASCIFTEGYD